MTKKLLILGIVTFLIGAYKAQAQVKVHIGALTSVNSTFVMDKGLSEDPRYSAAMTYKWSPIGLAFGTDFNNGLGLQLESMLANQGQIYHIVDVAKQKIGERRIDMEFIQLPLLLRMMGSGDSRTKFNFMFGPQLSILTYAKEVYNQYQNGTLVLPEGAEPPSNSTEYDSQNQTYKSPAQTVVIASTTGKSSVEDFKKQNLELAVGFGLNIGLSDNIYLSTNVRGVYGFTDMRNEDFINKVKNNTGNALVKDLFGQRANASVGLQLGLHYTFGGGASGKSFRPRNSSY